jgi:diacylglycerol kinase
MRLTMIKISKCLKSFSFAFKGVYHLFKNENNAKVHLLATVLVIAAGVFLKLEINEWLWIIFAIGLVWITEAINTAIEKTVDLLSPDFNPKAGMIKDLAAAAVLIAAIIAAVIGLLVFLPNVL